MKMNFRALSIFTAFAITSVSAYADTLIATDLNDGQRGLDVIHWASLVDGTLQGVTFSFVDENAAPGIVSGLSKELHDMKNLTGEPYVLRLTVTHGTNQVTGIEMFRASEAKSAPSRLKSVATKCQDDRAIQGVGQSNLSQIMKSTSSAAVNSGVSDSGSFQP